MRIMTIFTSLRHLPSLLRLSVSLFQDPRVPLSLKLMVVGGIALVLSPIDLPAWVPILGEGWDLLAIVGILDLFVRNAPAYVVEEHTWRLGLEWHP